MNTKDKKSGFFKSKFFQKELPIYVLIIILVPIIIVFFVEEDGVPLYKKLFAPKFDEALLNVCVSLPKMEGEIETSLSETAKIVVVTTEIFEATETGEVYIKWHDALPENRIPSDTNEVDVIICVDEGEIFLEMCNYSGGESISRTKYRPEVIAIERETGKVFATTYLQGPPPKSEECPWARVDVNSVYKGEMPTQEFLSWIEENIP